MNRKFSASQFAELKLPGLPKTLARCSNFINRMAAENPELVELRAGRGGGFVVDLCALPDVAQAELRARYEQDLQDAADAQADANAIELTQRRVMVAQNDILTRRQLMVRAARASILSAIEAEALTRDVSLKSVIKRWSNAGQVALFSSDMREMITLANDRSHNALLSQRTLYRWFSLRNNNGVSGLAPLPTIIKEKPDWLDGYLKHYRVPSKPSMADALRAYARTLPKGVVAPTFAQVRHRLKNLDALTLAKGRHGVLALRAMKRFKKRDFSDVLPSSIYVGDGKTFDAEIAHPIHSRPFRPELTTIVDVATRRVVGWSAALDENIFAVVDALRNACAFAGVPALFYTDRGRGYKNKAFDDVVTGFFARTGITAMRALPYNSQAKGVVERINQVYTAAAKSLPTYLGKDMDKEAKLLAFKQTRHDLKNVGHSKFLCSWARFLELIDETLSDYNNRPHSSLPKFFDTQLNRQRHMTPNECWAVKSADIDLIIPDQEELDDMWRPYVIRKTSRGLVSFNSNEYTSLKLERFHGEEVAVGYDLKDASQVWVRELTKVNGEMCVGSLICVAPFNAGERYVPFTMERAALETRALGRERRVMAKLTDIADELGPAFIEINPVPKATIAEFEYVQEAQIDAAPLTLEAQDEIPRFMDDVSYVQYYAAHPHKADAQDRNYLRELLTTHSMRELLRMHQVDLEDLITLLRSEPHTHSN